MENSRIARKQKSSQEFSKKSKLVVLILLTASCLFTAWYLNYKLTFTFIAVIIFFGTICLKPMECKKYLPGINSPSILIRCISSLIYLLAVIALISHAGQNVNSFQ
ncbi:hypothetical protein [Dendrosporobacter sp. 1207_IL3150]|uniref:hypothetical protein n=1 Tax=Dendrosporobacter sp. 1207_IL3150 TaxID=3084054 RepID=UPI002FD9232F